ncbi:MAG: alpha-1,4 polygalactosaminidase [Phycisphaerae bacterium]|nr:alpha-1,4 polygalactosaminidase [Phycisphaerae bacterium]
MSDAEHIEVLGELSDEAQGWDPVIGEEATATVARTLSDENSQHAVLQSSREILSQCTSPNEADGDGTGLVVGYVQSGKTLSFTTVAALASDNRFRIIIVIAGMTSPLSRQSYGRLLCDLGVEETPFSRWAEFFEPSLDDVPRIRDVLAGARDETVPERHRRTVLITLKKNHTRLRALNAVIRELGEAVHVPTLVIDDEADQASLNNLVRSRGGQLSTTYRRLRQLRALLPHHTFLQYTATPQAPLLINLIDVLSPDFPVVLEPGPDYVGGTTFFAAGSPYVADIPPNEIPTADHPLHEPPDSLIRALQFFFVGVASGLIRRDLRPRNRSMMVHPTHRTIGHSQYHTWVQTIRTRWSELLALPASDPDCQQLLEQFQVAHADLAATVDDLEEFGAIAAQLLEAIRETYVRLLNSLPQANRDIHWNRNYSWILIGGQVLDRGFTVEGLTVTYMPRGPGVGNADTIQQRARFLGYKRQYLGYCRVFLEATVSDLYLRYVQHEEDVRTRLIQHIETGRPLSEFRRVFLLDRRLRPTRQSVIDIDYARPTFTHGWCVPSSPQEADVAQNRDTVEAFVGRYAARFAADEGHPDRTDHQQHLVAREVPLGAVYDELLIALQTRDFEDSQRWTAALTMISSYLGIDPDAVCTVYQMRPNVETRRQLRDGRIRELFQGAHPDARGHVYPGDRRLHDAPVTVQLHTVTLREGARADSPLVEADVKFAAIWMAPEVLQDVVVQPQGGD